MVDWKRKYYQRKQKKGKKKTGDGTKSPGGGSGGCVAVETPNGWTKGSGLLVGSTNEVADLSKSCCFSCDIFSVDELDEWTDSFISGVCSPLCRLFDRLIFNKEPSECDICKISLNLPIFFCTYPIRIALWWIRSLLSPTLPALASTSAVFLFLVSRMMFSCRFSAFISTILALSIPIFVVT